MLFRTGFLVSRFVEPYESVIVNTSSSYEILRADSMSSNQRTTEAIAFVNHCTKSHICGALSTLDRILHNGWQNGHPCIPSGTPYLGSLPYVTHTVKKTNRPWITSCDTCQICRGGHETRKRVVHLPNTGLPDTGTTAETFFLQSCG